MNRPSVILRRPLGVLLATVAVLCASLAIQPIAHADETAPPVLWEGEIRTPDGRAAGGADVVAYARPPAASIKAGHELVEVARTTTDQSGRFVLRAWPDTTMTMADQAGWATIMLTAFSADGMSLAVDSVAFEPTPYSAKSMGAHRTSRTGRWVTSPAERFREPGTYRALSVEDEATANEAERPAVLVLEPGAKAERGRFVAAEVPKARRGCWNVGEKDLGVRPVKVGELHLNRHWGGNFTYTSTRSSSFQIGVSRSGDNWKLGGSVSLGNEVSGESGGPDLPARDADEVYLWDAQMVFKRLSWGCGGEMNHYFIDTVEPVQWTGGMWQYAGT
ncbi:MAG TPA: hypothetical protein VG795_12435, partial [Acidimicrobiia bacterium]|nr:hypothetical protein [Acidimicrobiia bacterium]